MTLNVRRSAASSHPQRGSRHSVFSSQGSPRFPGSVAPAGLLCDFRREPCATAAMSRMRWCGVREPRPRESSHCEAHASPGDAVFIGESRLRLSGGIAAAALKDGRLRQPGALMRVAADKRPVPQPVLAGVLDTRAVGKVGQSVVLRPSRAVAYNEALWARPGKSLHDQLVHKHGLRPAVHGRGDAQVPAFVRGCRAKHLPPVGIASSVAVDHYPVDTPHATLVTDLVRAFQPLGRQPSLGRSITCSHCGLLVRSWRSGPDHGARNTVRAAIKFLLIIADSSAISAAIGAGGG
jgi:hypothetical protein